MWVMRDTYSCEAQSWPRAIWRACCDEAKAKARDGDWRANLEQSMQKASVEAIKPNMGHPFGAGKAGVGGKSLFETFALLKLCPSS